MNEWVDKDRTLFEARRKNTKIKKQLKNVEAMLVLQWHRKDFFDLPNSCGSGYGDDAIEGWFNIIYNASVEILIYTKDEKYFIESSLFGDSLDSLREDWSYEWKEKNYASSNLNLNHIYAKELLQKLAPHKLEYFFKERMSGFLQIPVRVSIDCFLVDYEPVNYELYDVIHTITDYIQSGENLGKELYETRSYAYIKDIQKLGQAIEFEDLNEKDLVLEDKFNFAPRFKKSKPYNVKVTNMYKEHELRYKHKIMPKNDKDLWIDLMSNTKKLRSKKPINLKDLRPDYVKFKGLWATTRSVFNFDRAEYFREMKWDNGSVVIENDYIAIEDPDSKKYKIHTAKDYKYIIYNGKKYKLIPPQIDNIIEYYTCEVPIFSKPYGASKLVATMLIALPYIMDFNNVGCNDFDGDFNLHTWRWWMDAREDFIKEHPNALSPNHYAIFIHNILENDMAEISICAYDVLNPKEPNYKNLKNPLHSKCYIPSAYLIPMPDFNRDEGGIMYPSAKFARLAVEEGNGDLCYGKESYETCNDQKADEDRYIYYIKPKKFKYLK